MELGSLFISLWRIILAFQNRIFNAIFIHRKFTNFFQYFLGFLFLKLSGSLVSTGVLRFVPPFKMVSEFMLYFFSEQRRTFFYFSIFSPIYDGVKYFLWWTIWILFGWRGREILRRVECNLSTRDELTRKFLGSCFLLNFQFLF